MPPTCACDEVARCRETGATKETPGVALRLERVRMLCAAAQAEFRQYPRLYFQFRYGKSSYLQRSGAAVTSR